MQIGIVPRALSTMRADEGYGEKRKLNYCNPYNIGRQAIVMIYRVKIKENAAYRNYLRVIVERTMPTLKDPRPLGPLWARRSENLSGRGWWGDYWLLHRCRIELHWVRLRVLHVHWSQGWPSVGCWLQTCLPCIWTSTDSTALVKGFMQW